jgi:hypothetical protein
MTGQVVVITGMMIVGVDAGSDGIHQCQVMRLFRKHRQMLAQRDARSGRRDRLKRSSVFPRSLQLHIPRVNVRGPATQEKQDCRLRFAGL